MLDQLKEMIKKVMPEVDSSKVTLDTKLVDDLSFDSLAIMMLSIELENTFNFRFEEQVNFVTVGDVVKYLEKNNLIF